MSGKRDLKSFQFIKFLILILFQVERKPVKMTRHCESAAMLAVLPAMEVFVFRIRTFRRHRAFQQRVRYRQVIIRTTSI